MEKIPGKTVPDTATAQIIRIVTAVLYKKGVKWLFRIFRLNPKLEKTSNISYLSQPTLQMAIKRVPLSNVCNATDNFLT